MVGWLLGRGEGGRGGGGGGGVVGGGGGVVGGGGGGGGARQEVAKVVDGCRLIFINFEDKANLSLLLSQVTRIQTGIALRNSAIVSF